MAFLKKTDTAGEGRETRYSAIKVRIYPTPEQARIMDHTFACCRYIWNKMLADEQEFYAATGIHYIPTPAKYKKSAPFLKEADSQALTAVHQNLQRAFQDFFSRPESSRYPVFKKRLDKGQGQSQGQRQIQGPEQSQGPEQRQGQKCSYRTYCHHYPDGRPDSIRIEGEGIVLPKVKWVRAKLHRRPLHWWKIQDATVSRTPSGKYFCSLLFQYEVRQPEPLTPDPERTLGLKYSVTHFYVDSDGACADPPRWMAESAEKLAEMQRKLSRMQPGSNNYHEQKRKIARLYEHVANQRLDYIHKESSRLAQSCDAVCVRSDDLTELSQRVKYGSIPDSGFGKFRECLEYKLERQGKRYIPVVRAAQTTQSCRECGNVNAELDRKNLFWTCPHCGARLSRETNAAVNIKNVGLAQCKG